MPVFKQGKMQHKLIELHFIWEKNKHTVGRGYAHQPQLQLWEETSKVEMLDYISCGINEWKG